MKIGGGGAGNLGDAYLCCVLKAAISPACCTFGSHSGGVGRSSSPAFWAFNGCSSKAAAVLLRPRWRSPSAVSCCPPRLAIRMGGAVENDRGQHGGIEVSLPD